jgi:hypothetical protein
VQQYPNIGLLKPEGVTHFLRGAALDVPEDEDQPLVLRQRLDGVLEMLACLPAQEPTLRRGFEVRLTMCPGAKLGPMLGRLEAVRADGGRRLDLLVETSYRHRASFTYGAGLRAVDEDAKDPGLE